jgi:RNA polymerase sigma-70 factor (ECF subfamily)
LIRKKRKRRQHIAHDTPLSNGVIEDNLAFSDESLNLLYAAIKKLSEVDRAVILLYLDEKPNKEIADIIGTTPNNIGVRVNRIKDRLKNILDGKIN